MDSLEREWKEVGRRKLQGWKKGWIMDITK